MPRFGELPRIDVEMLDRKNVPSAGAGETPLVGLAPAVGNAIFAALGVVACPALGSQRSSADSTELKGS